MCKVCMVTHPGWTSIGDDNMLEEMKEYGKYIQQHEFDKIIVFLPKADPFLRETIWERTYMQAIDYVLYNKPLKGSAEVYLRERGIDIYISGLLEAIKISKKIKDPIMKKHALKLKLRKYMSSKFFKDEALRDDFSGIMFEGDYNFIDDYDKFEKFWSDDMEQYAKDDAKMTRVDGGSIESVLNIIKFVVDETQLTKDDDITVIGEYANQCVTGLNRWMVDNGYKSKIDTTACVVNTCEEYDESLTYRRYHKSGECQ